MSVDTFQGEHTAEKQKLDEYDLYRGRLHTVEEEAGEGLYGGEAFYFLATVEQEGHILVMPELAASLSSGNYDAEGFGESVNKFNIILPEDLSTLAVLTDAERKELEDGYREQAREYVSALTAHNEEEERRKRDWLANVDSFTTEDIINFRLYKEFSTPTLGSTAPPKSIDHAQMNDFTDQSDWMEFRFGNGTLQSGYYDNPGVVESRLNPCSPSVLIEREEIIQKRYVEIAAEHGALITNGGKHINLSIYSPRYEDQQWRWMPILGRQEDRREKTMAAVSGLSAAIEDGAWMRHATAENRFLFGNIAGGQKWQITTQRNALRLQDDYVELRNATLIGSTAHGLLWMMAGMTNGLERGAVGVAEAGHTPAELEGRIVAERTDKFDKDIDLQMQRALEQSELSERGLLVPNEQHLQHRSTKFTEAVIGDPLDEGAALAFTRLFLISLNIDESGRLSFDEEAYKHCHGLLPDIYRDLSDKIDALIDPATIEAAKRYADRDGVRINIQQVIRALPHYPGITPEEWEKVWADSPIVQRMYGKDAARYGKEVFATAAEHYEPIDTSDPVQYAAAFAALAEKAIQHRG